MIGAIEIGGTHTVYGLFSNEGILIDKYYVLTGSPKDFIENSKKWFSEHPVSSVGIASFGPICINSNAPEYGSILMTPKAGWTGFNVKHAVETISNTPVYVDTDVNCACIGEKFHGDYSKYSNLVYITVGTGIGAGVLINGKLLRSILHPEVGHIPVRLLKDELFKGCCPFHSCCVEGMASGKAIELRTGIKGEDIPSDDPVWMHESEYLAQLVYSVMIRSPHRGLFSAGTSWKNRGCWKKSGLRQNSSTMDITQWERM